MVERYHRTLQAVIKKVMQSQEDWYSLLNSILFAMHSQNHSSIGYSPMRMLYQKDTILPFEMADKLNNGDVMDERDNTCGNDVNKVFNMVEEIHKQRQKIFSCASTRIKKAQRHQAKAYDNRHASGTTFEVSMKVLHKNSREHQCCSKLKSTYLGPYTILSCCANGNFRLKDCYSHALKTSIHPSKLVRFYEDKMYKINEKGQVDGEVDSDGCDDSSIVKLGQNEISSSTDADCEDVHDVHSTECE